MCDLFWEEGGGGRNPIDGELLPYGILSGGRKSMGGGGVPCDTGFALFWQHDVSQKQNQFHTIIINHISLEICLLVPRSENYDQSAHRKRKHYIP